MRRLTPWLLPAPLLSALLLGCASAAPSAALEAPTIVDPAVPGLASVDADGAGMGVSGLQGTLSPRQVREVLRPRLPEITGCFAMRAMSFEALGGSLRMRIHVSPSGEVRSVHPEDSTVGDREVERCVGRVIAGLRFPRPQGGGAAQVSWSMTVDPPESVREPRTWDPGRVARAVRRGTRRARRACGVLEPVQVTAYVSRRGRVLNVGAASTTETDADRLDCVAAQVRRWRMPRAPRIAKVTFDLAEATSVGQEGDHALERLSRLR